MDISLVMNQTRFNYRVGAVIIKDKKILLVTNQAVDYYYSVGGRVKIGETSLEAVKREVYEETSLKIDVIKLLAIHENFFIEENTSEPFHEISLFYLMDDHFNIEDVRSNSHTESNVSESIQWVPFDKLDEITLYPAFLKEKLRNNNVQFEHFITTKNDF